MKPEIHEQCAELIKQRGTPAWPAARAKIVTLMLPLVRGQARRGPRHLFDDLVGEGNFVVWQCTETFRADRGVLFATYANVSVRNMVMDFVQKEYARTSFLHSDTTGTETTTLIDQAVSPADTARDAETAQLTDHLNAYLAELPPLDACAFRAYYGSDRSITDARNATGLSATALTTRAKKTMKKLRARFNAPEAPLGAKELGVRYSVPRRLPAANP